MEETIEAQAPAVQQLIEAATTILLGCAGAPISVAKLGQKIVAQTGTPIRVVLGARPLGPFLERQLTGRAVLSGEGADRQITLTDGPAIQGTQFLYDTAVFAAFSKPLPLQHRRHLNTTRPFRFVDSLNEVGPAGSREVLAEEIVSPAIPRSERRAAVEAQIESWCARNQIAPGTLHNHSSVRASASPATPHNEDTLRLLIAAIPPSERRNYSLPMDLVARLLGL